MARFACRTCGEFWFENDTGQCPKCGKVGWQQGIFPKVDVHFIVMDEKGPIPSVNGRQFIACEPKRDRFGTEVRHYHASGDVRAVTCRSCMSTPHFKERAKEFAEMADTLRELEKLKAEGGVMIEVPKAEKE